MEPGIWRKGRGCGREEGRGRDERELWKGKRGREGMRERERELERRGRRKRARQAS